ncbi:MAG: peptidoglycan DD-metalloendopeptidase family protein [Solirubrobacterales bacterium]|nr:peptidoglycan DD-metalloendopeptidase family protein [Solirubrobacterales bacterium]
MRLRLLLTGALLPLALWLFTPVLSQGAPSTDKAAKLQRDIDVARQKIQRRKGTEKVLTGDIAGYNRRIDRLQGKIGTLQGRERTVQNDLDAKRRELSRLQDELRAERARLTRLRARLAVAKDALARRLVELYQADAPDLVSVVLNADGFADLLERGEYLSRVGEQDQRVLKLVRTAKAEATATEEKLDGLEARQKEVTVAVQKRRDEISQIKQGLIDVRVGYDNTRAGKARALGNVREQRGDLENELEVAESAQAKIRAELAAAARRNAQSFGASPGGGSLPAQPIQGGGGPWIFPVSGPITGVFGEQRPGHLHAGVDIAAPEGTPLRAAANGRVALMQPTGASGGYGNYTCIQHTATLASCYAHQVRFGTSVGANVKQGQVIGYVGNTGNSFGAHLHFEARVNGVPVQPMNYL